MQRSIDKANYYKLFDELAALGRLRRLRLQREAIQEKNQPTKSNGTQKGRKDE